MPSWQLQYLEKARARTANTDTIYIDLPKNEQIGMILVDFSCYNTSPTSRDYTRTILDVVKSVTVLAEGSKTLYHCDPKTGSFISFNAMGKVPDHNIKERGQTNMRLPILFGRYPKDPEFLLDTSQYSSVQLQVAYAMDTTYETTGTAESTIWIMRPVTRVVPRGFMRSRVVRTYTSTGSAEIRQLDIPTGLPWRLVGLRNFDIDAFLEKCITDVDFNLDEGRLHLFNGRIQELKQLNAFWYGRDVLANRLWALTKSEQYVQHMTADPENITWSHYAAGHAMYSSSEIWSNRHTIHMVDDTGATIAVDRDFQVQAVGGHPYSCLALGKWDDEPYNSGQHAQAYTELTLGAYASVTDLFLVEQVPPGF